MLSLKGYEVTELLAEKSEISVYRCRRLTDDFSIIAKTNREDARTPRVMARINHEFEITRDLDFAGIIKPFALERHSEGLALLFEDYNGRSLKHVLNESRPDIDAFLNMAIQLADILSEVHAHNLIHKDIKPDNIVVLSDGNCRLIDFGISSRVNLKTLHLGNPEVLEGTLAYISPEQTGRMNRVVDYRSDLYSLGVTFYEMLTGRLPFEAGDSLELVHQHMAVTAPEAHNVNPRVPEMLSRIVARLMAKSAEKRYQSAAGLRHDLGTCLERLRDGRIADFDLGTNDYSGRFQISQKLYGRDEQRVQLMNAFERVAAGGGELMLVSGYSGVGKSALVNEVHEPITGKRGYFIAGKYDQFQRDIPYYAIRQAFEEFSMLLLTESTESLEQWKRRILDAVGNNGQVLIEFIPGLEAVLGTQPAVAELGPQESQNRFNLVSRNFVRAISHDEHPLVMFIDDLQWADSASLSLIKTLMTDAEKGHLLFVGAYRDNEVDASHPFILTLEEIKKAETIVDDIILRNLSRDDVDELIAEALQCEPERARELTELVYGKTQGNPFFTTELLKTLYTDELLRFDFKANAWEWNVPKIAALNITDNVVELMTEKLSRLKNETRSVLKLASCIGGKFELKILSIIHERTMQETLEDLWSAVQEGLLLPMDENYRLIADARDIKSDFKFAHDRVQQASYSLIEDRERKKLHLKIGRLLLEHTPENEIEERIFDLANQFNAGRDLVRDSDEILVMAKLNRKAGRKAKSSAAYDSAARYLKYAYDGLGEEKWSREPELSYDIIIELADAETLNSNHEEAEKLIHIALKHATNVLAKTHAYEVWIRILNNRNQLRESLERAREILGMLGARLPKKPNFYLHVGPALARTRLLIMLRGGRDYLLKAPRMSEPLKLAAMRIMTNIASTAYQSDFNLFAVIVMRLTYFSYRYGNAPSTPYGIGLFSMAWTGVLGLFKIGYAYGQLSLRLLEKLQAREVHARTSMVFNTFIRHWIEPVSNGFEDQMQGGLIGLETGDLEFGGYNYFFKGLNESLSAGNFGESLEHFKNHYRLLEPYNQAQSLNVIRIWGQLCENLSGDVRDPATLNGSFMNEKDMKQLIYDTNYGSGIGYFHHAKAITLYLTGRYQEARDEIDGAYNFAIALMAMTTEAALAFHDALILIKIDAPEDRPRIRRRLKSLESWSRLAPFNQEHRVFLIKALIHRRDRDMTKAGEMFEKALEAARRNGMKFDSALILENMAEFYYGRMDNKLAVLFMREARSIHEECGVSLRARELERNFPELLEARGTGTGRGDTLSHKSHESESHESSSSSSSSGSLTTAELLDMESVLKASRTISGEIRLEDLLRKMMRLVIENAGAESAMLLLSENGRLVVQATSTAAGDVKTMQGVPASEDLLPLSIVEYVRRTEKDLVLGNALEEGQFTRSPYVRSTQARSILAAPITRQGRLTGILYLENNLATNVFTAERLETLNILSSQLAVSLENALLYADMEQKVVDRTAKLSEARDIAEHERQKADDLLDNILPAAVARELKKAGIVQPLLHESVTIMFTDFVGFTKSAGDLSPDALVRMLDAIFLEFDQIAERHKVEKLKTIGDAYMCAGGLPLSNATHAIDICHTALQFQTFIRQARELRSAAGDDIAMWEMRVGVHTGAAMAGVIGKTRFSYDIWGDTVNVAARMESGGTPGRINVSDATHALVSPFFDTEYRGKFAIKNRGEIDMYYVNRIRPELSMDEEGLRPNKRFQEMYADLERISAT